MFSEECNCFFSSCNFLFGYLLVLFKGFELNI